MARRQASAGRRGAARLSRAARRPRRRRRPAPRRSLSADFPEVVVHSLAEAHAALHAARDLGARIALRSAPDAGHYTGALFFGKIVEALEAEFDTSLEWVFWFDCGEDAGLALNALRHGLTHLCGRTGAQTDRRLANIARRMGAAYRRETARSRRPALDLIDEPEPYDAVRRVLEGAGRGR